MTSKEKAKEIIEKYLKLDIEIGGQHDGYLTMKMHDAKQCALIAVEQLIEHSYQVMKPFWQEVKQEICDL